MSFYILKICCRKVKLVMCCIGTFLQVNLGLPRPQRVVQLPDITWGRYTSGLGDFEREFCDKKCKTRRLTLMFDKGRCPRLIKLQIMFVVQNY